MKYTLGPTLVGARAARADLDIIKIEIHANGLIALISCPSNGEPRAGSVCVLLLLLLRDLLPVIC